MLKKNFTLLLLASLFLASCGPGRSFGPTISPSPTSTPTFSPTFTPTVTSSPTITPSLTPTPYGFGSGEFLYTIGGTLYSSVRGLLFNDAQLKAIIPAEVNLAEFINPSPDGKMMEVTVLGAPILDGSGGVIGNQWSHYLVSTDLSHVIPIIPDAEIYQLTWSPDGLKIAGVEWKEHWPYFFWMDESGNNIKELEANSFYGPFWYSDSSKLYIFRSYPKFDQLNAINIEDLTEKPYYLYYLGNTYRDIKALVFSPDGSKVAFSVLTSRYPPPPYNSYIANGDFSNPVKIIKDKLNYPQVEILSIKWSPDMQLVLFNYLAGSYPASPELKQFLVNASDGQNIPILSPDGSIFCGWSPDMKLIAYIENQTLFLADAQDPYIRQELADTRGKEGDPTGGGCPMWVIK